MTRSELTDLKVKLRNAQSLLMDAAAAYERGGFFAGAQRLRRQAREITEEIEYANERLAALPITPAAGRAQ